MLVFLESKARTPYRGRATPWSTQLLHDNGIADGDSRRREVAASAVAFRPMPTAAQEAGDLLVTRLESRLSMGGGDFTLVQTNMEKKTSAYKKRQTERWSFSY
ncbi:hypothetical protein EVAR_45811_1 [Eumeta japonica]|uniref:Uncharacterized protein n=1 Tax=Eumeta variegata TaxID=151549 RepID=A0A4C1X483_EUMVA|nr:hypothetical protein EVAR_45811_1 [Eumeta japonica]